MVFNSSTCPISWLVHAVASRPNATEIDALADELHDDLATSIALALTLLCASLFVLFLGNRLVRPTLFLTSFVCAGASTLALMPSIVSNFTMSDTSSCLWIGLTPLGVGLAAGLISLSCLTFGMAVLGGGAGAGAGYALYIGVLHLAPLWEVGSTTLMLILCVCLGAMAGAAIIVKFEKSVLIVATSAVGAMGAISATALLLAHYDARFLGSFQASVDVEGNSYSFVWPQALAMLVLLLLGVLVQCKLDQRHKKRMSGQTSALRNARVPLIVP